MEQTQKNKDFTAAKEAILAEPRRFWEDSEILAAFIHHTEQACTHGDNVRDIRDQIIARMRIRLSALEEQHHNTISLVHENFVTMQQIHDAVLHLMHCHTLEAFIETLHGPFLDILSVDTLRLVISNDFAAQIGLDRHDALCLLDTESLLAFQLGKDRQKTAPIILRPVTDISKAIYGPDMVGLESEALLSFSSSDDNPKALLAMGSRAADQFSSRQNTDLLEFLRKSVACMLHLWV